MMSGIPRFSIVVPACGVAPYAARMIESVRNQTFPEFEALIECEPGEDETENAIRAAVGDDPRFQILRHPRTGSASVSRNDGIARGAGRYLVFLDGDDWLENDALARFAKAADDYGEPEIITVEARIWRDGTELEGRKRHDRPGRMVSGPDALIGFFRDGSFRTATWSNLYRSDWLRATGLLQAPGRRHQDDEWTPRVFCAARRVLISGIVAYNYRRREKSVTTDDSPRSVTDIAANLGTLLDFLDGTPLPEELFYALGHWQCRTIIHFFSPQWIRKFPAPLRRRALRTALEPPARRRVLRRLRPVLTVREKIFLSILRAAVRLGPLSPADALHRLLFRREGRKI